MAATERGALWKAALALPIAVIPARAGAAEVGEVGVTLLGYKERGLMKITEPILWGQATFAETWEVSGSAAVDIITGASPQLVSNASGKPVQTVSGASISDRRTTWDAKVGRRFGDFTFSASRAVSREEDYISHAFGLEARWDTNAKLTTFTAAFGRSNDRVRSSDDPSLDEHRGTDQYLFGVSQVISPVAAIQSTVTYSRGRGWFNDPYKFTLTFHPDADLVIMPDRRPSERDTWAWITRYRHHFAAQRNTLQAEYRFYHDDWGIDAHTLEVALHHDFNEAFALRPALRYYTQSAADFYSPVIPQPQPDILSSDQRLGAFGGLSPSLRGIYRFADGTRVEATAGYIVDSRSLHLGGRGSEAFSTLRAAYGLVSISHAF